MTLKSTSFFFYNFIVIQQKTTKLEFQAFFFSFLSTQTILVQEYFRILGTSLSLPISRIDGMLQSWGLSLWKIIRYSTGIYTPKHSVMTSQVFVSDFKPSAKSKEGEHPQGGRGHCIGAGHGLFEGGLLSEQRYLTPPKGLLCACCVMFEDTDSISFYKNALRCLFLVLFL